MIKEYILPVKILLYKDVDNSDVLLNKQVEISTLANVPTCNINGKGFILLDFGKEYNGGIKIVTKLLVNNQPTKIRIRFGESAMECMSDIGYKGATNDHAIRDFETLVPFLGFYEFGNTGFRFCRIDNLEDFTIPLLQVECAYEHSGKQIKGSFKCNDDMLNKIWEAGARTIYLNNNNVITDGIKRDRLLWIGDLHPEASSILSLFGNDYSLVNSLRIIRDTTPPNEFMNNIASYSMWWIKILYDYYYFTQDKDFLKENLDYLKDLITSLISLINDDGSMNIDLKFIDWPSNANPIAQECGLFAMMSIAINCSISIFKLFNLDYSFLTKTLDKLHKFNPNPNGNKMIASILGFSKEEDCTKINNEILNNKPLDGLSTFLFYYLLITKARANDVEGALNLLKEFYGAMINLGATTFWEDFSYDWKDGAKPIDSILKEGEYDVHGDRGNYCYVGYRHSFCHGWSSGFIAFISEYVLGAKVKGNEVTLNPNIGSLEWVEGTVPTINGNVYIKAYKQNGKLIVEHKEDGDIKVITK